MTGLIQRSSFLLPPSQRPPPPSSTPDLTPAPPDSFMPTSPPLCGPQDPELGPLAAAAQAASGAVTDSSVVNATKDRRSFLLPDGLLYRSGPRDDRLCIPAEGGLRLQVLMELHATSFGGHFGREKTLALAPRSVWWPGLPATVEEYIRSCPICQRVKADHLQPAGLLFLLPRAVPTRAAAASASTSSTRNFR